MSKGLPYSHKRGSQTETPIFKANLLVTDLIVSVVDGAPGFGTAVIRGLPEGNIILLGIVCYFEFESQDGDISATFEGDYSIGSAPTADGVLAGAEIDIIASTAIAAATAGVSPDIKGISTQTQHAKFIDNTANDKELNLNLLIDDLSISGAADFTVNGSVHFLYSVLGDD